MSHGVRTLDDIRDRCVMDSETACWHWRLAMTNATVGTRAPRVCVANGVLPPGEACDTTASRAAWLLAGRRIPKGHIVYRKCLSHDCCNPWHMACASRAQWGESVAESGRWRGPAMRSITMARNRRTKALPVERVREIERRLAAGQTIDRIKTEMRTAGATVRAIRDGLHYHSARRSDVVAVLPTASVFTWGLAA